MYYLKPIKRKVCSLSYLKKDFPRLWTVKWPVLVSLMFPFTLAGTYTEAERLCRTLEAVKHKTMQYQVLPKQPVWYQGIHIYL